MEFNVSDPKNIVGISSLMNDEMDSNDILELEKEIINGINIQEEEDVNTKQYQRDMERITKAYDLNNMYQDDQSNSLFIDDTYGDDDQDKDDNTYRQKTMEPKQFSTSYESSSRKTREYIPKSIEDEQLRYMTLEQKKQNYVDDVLQDITDERDIEFNIDKEKEEDDKNSLLEQIDMLRMTLEDEGTDISNIPLVNKNSNMQDIQNVYKILRLKNDRNRYCSFAEELILAGAYGLEYLFDGEKEWFGRKPDLVGWSKTVQIKLRRCRYQTSTFVKDIMQEYNMSSGVQLLIELVPSMFLFSRRKKLSNKENIKNDTRTEEKYDEAFSNLNSLN